MLNIPTYSLGMKLRYSVVAGATILILASPQEGLLNNYIRVDPAGNNEEVFVTAVEGAHVTFTPALSNGYEADTSVTRVLGPSDLVGRTRSFLVSPQSGYDVMTSLALVRTDAMAEGLPMADGNVTYVFGEFLVPVDYVSDMTIQPIVVSAATGDIYASGHVYYSAVGETWDGHDDQLANAARAITLNKHNGATASMTLSTPAAGDIVHVQFTRTGDNVLDTVGNTVFFIGWMVTYRADS